MKTQHTNRITPVLRENVAGIESEVHIVTIGRASRSIRQKASVLVRQAVLHRHGLWRCRDCKDSDSCGRSEFLANGARCYIDHGYLEYSTQSSSSTRQAVAAMKAGDAIVSRAVKDASDALGPKVSLMAVRNTCDNRGHSYAAHLNVSMTRQAFDRLMEDKGEMLHETIGPMLASIPLVCGAGRAGSDRGEDIFQISQRADYIRTERALQTTYDRPLLNTRDEPLADGSRHARLHVICLDANRLETPEFLKVGVLRLMCASLDLGLPTVAIPIDAPVQAMHCISRSPFGPIRLATGRTITALGIQEAFLSALSKRSGDLAGRVPDVLEILSMWEDVLATLRRDHLELVGVLDWVTKFACLEVARRDAGARWSDPRLAWRDIGYHALTDPLDEDGREPPVIDRGRKVSEADVEALVANPPRGGRDEVRVSLMRRFPEDIVACDWHWIASRDGSCLLLPDPAAGPKETPDYFQARTSLTGSAEASRATITRADSPGPSSTGAISHTGSCHIGGGLKLPTGPPQVARSRPAKDSSSPDGPR